MDAWLARARTARMLSTALPLIFEATEYAREARAGELIPQLEYLSEELIYLHRQVLDLPPEKTPAACEFERAQLHEDDSPF